MRRTVIIILVLVVVVGSGVAIALLLRPKTYSIAADESIEKLVVKTDTIIATVNAAGRLEAADSIDLAFDINGKVAKVYVMEGDQVLVGDLLAELDATDLAYAVTLAELDLQKAVAELERLQTPPTETDIVVAQTSLDSAKAALDERMAGAAEAELRAAQISLDSARAELQRLLNGPDANSIKVASADLRKAEISLAQAQDAYNEVAYDSRAAAAQGQQLQQATIDYEAALANYNLKLEEADNADILAAQAKVANAESTLDQLLNGTKASEVYNARANVAEAEAKLADLLEGPTDAEIVAAQTAIDTAVVNLEKAKLALEQSKLWSTIDGTITNVKIKRGGPVTARETALSINDLSTFKLVVEIDEIDISRIDLGQPVTINLDSLPEEDYTGEVTRIGIAPAEGATSGIVAYPVTIVIDNRDTPFMLGMNVNATIETERLEDAVVVENRAITFDRSTGKAFVEKVVDDQTTEQTEVTLGRRGTSVSQIVDGVSVGDTVVIRERSRREELQRALQGE